MTHSIWWHRAGSATYDSANRSPHLSHYTTHSGDHGWISMRDLPDPGVCIYTAVDKGSAYPYIVQFLDQVTDLHNCRSGACHPGRGGIPGSVF
jgi:hypothetical protein